MDRLPRLIPAFVAAIVATATAPAHAAAPRGLLDHSLCCGPAPATIHGDGTFDPAPDPLLRRRRAPVPPAAPAPSTTPPSSPASANAATTVQGTDGAPTETPAPSAPASPIASHPNGTAAPEAPQSPAATAPALASTEPPAPLRLPTTVIEGHLDVGFETLGAYPLQLTKEQALAIGANDRPQTDALNAQIPDVIRQLDGKKTLITGFMLPVKLEEGLATELLLVSSSMLCCYGVVPPMNQWVVVKMNKGGVKPVHDVPVQIFGTLRVGPRVENGMLSTLYVLEGDKFRSAK